MSSNETVLLFPISIIWFLLVIMGICWKSFFCEFDQIGDLNTRVLPERGEIQIEHINEVLKKNVLLRKILNNRDFISVTKLEECIT